MRPFLVLVWTIALVVTPARGSTQIVPEEVRAVTPDGITVYGDYFGRVNATGPLLLLFHQGGGSARGEYSTIAQRLVELGYDLLAFDLRRGGDRFGLPNRTVDGLGDQEFGYCDAYTDVQTALGYAEQHHPGRTFVAWGSSFSASLVVQLAATRGDVLAGALAFSPAGGEPLADCDPLQFSAAVHIPLLVLRPESEAAIASVAEQLQVFAEAGHRTFVARPGVHGSSMLDPERVDGDTSRTWAEVLSFLETLPRR